MSFSGKNILYLLSLIGVISGCSTKRNTQVSRAYQNLTSHYNIYFNAKESLKTGLQRIDKTVDDDFTHFLPVYKASNPDAGKAATSEMELAILKSSKLIALHSITRSPERRSNKSERYKKFASKGEYNKWVDDSYLLMGMASYYSHDFHRAGENLNYVIRKFPDNPIRYPAYLWLARNYTETGEYEKAAEIFKVLERDGGFPKKLKKELKIAQASYFLKNNDLPEVITYLKAGLESHFPKKEKQRYHYILAQLSAALDQPDEAVKQYKKVLKLKPPYQMAFNARISALELADGGNKETNNQLQKLLHDENNLEFRDRIYYARGQIALKENRKSDALNDFRLSVQNSTTNNHQRALSSLSAARMLFDANDYLLSACYYDSSMAVIDNDYPGYPEIKLRAESLRSLADNLNVISREDSLLKLAVMPENERNNLINSIISKFQEEERLKQTEASVESSDQNYFRAQQYRPQIRVEDGQNQWYFYNPTTVGIGKSEFQRIWGKRRLEDNWRRKNKISVNAIEMEELAQLVNETAASEERKKIADPKSREFYLQDIPLTDSLRVISNERIKAALFNAGKIYQSDFNDPQKAISTLEELNRRFPGSIYELSALFELYLINQQAGNTQQAESYKNRITKGYPGSKYAMYLHNPNFYKDIQVIREEVEKKYAETLEFYKAGDFVNAKRMAVETLAMNPDSSLVPKVKFIETVSGGPTMERTAFVNSLDQYIAAYPQSPTRESALLIRDLLKTNALADYQQLVSKGYINENIINDELKTDTKTGNDEFGGKYSYDEDMFHYFTILFSSEAKVDINRLIYDIANYNLDYYTSTDFDIEQVNLNAKTRMIVVRGFPDKEEGLIYFRSIIRKRQVYQSLKDLEYVNFIASSTNYRKIIEEKEYLDYLRFFMKNYSPYYTSSIPADELPPPAELIAKSRKADEPEEKGKFVLINPQAQVDPATPPVVKYEGPYNPELGKENLYALVFQPAESDIVKLSDAFKSFNEKNYSASSLKVSIVPLDDFRSILLVPGLGEPSSALLYFKKANEDPSVLSSLKKESYRHFIISPANLEILKKDKNLKSYLDFFNMIYK